MVKDAPAIHNVKCAGDTGLHVKDIAVPQVPSLWRSVARKYVARGKYGVAIDVRADHLCRTKAQRRHHGEPRTASDIEETLFLEILGWYKLLQTPRRLRDPGLID